MLKIETSLDWSNVETELHRLGNLLPAFKHDIKRIQDGLRPEIAKLSNLEVEDRRRHSPATRKYCNEQVELINERLKVVQNIHLMALLAQ